MRFRLLGSRGAVLRLGAVVCSLALLALDLSSSGEAGQQVVVIEVNETIGVSDSQQSLPPASVEQSETVQVADSAQIAPPVSIEVNESIGVSDTQQALPPASVDAAEGVIVSDSVAVIPPAVITVNETIAVSDGQQVVPPAVIEINETIAVTDTLGDSDADGTSDLADNCPTTANASQADGDTDGVGNVCDNCPATPNGPAERFVLGVGYQTDSDNDGVPGVQPPPGGTFGGDACDADDDNDGVADEHDVFCRTLPEDYDGFQDNDGCPDPDNDLDGICDPGQTSVSCTGSDVGQMCFDPAGTLSCSTFDCRNIAEDYDGFKDSDGCPEPDNDNDGFPDSTDDCPGTDAHAGPDGMLGSPQDLNHNGIKDPTESPLSTDDVVLTFEDYDGVLDTDGCHDSPGQDFDGDGYTDEAEEGSVLCNGVNNDAFDDGVIDDGCPGGPPQAGSFSEAQFRIGTKAFDPCGQDAWPSDLVSSGFSENKFDIVDLGSFLTPVRRMQSNPDETAFDSRWDLAPGNSGFGGFINIADLAATVTGARGFPPMLNGQKAFSRACPIAP
jgi:hypothetical protein